MSIFLYLYIYVCVCVCVCVGVEASWIWHYGLGEIDKQHQYLANYHIFGKKLGYSPVFCHLSKKEKNIYSWHQREYNTQNCRASTMLNYVKVHFFILDQSFVEYLKIDSLTLKSMACIVIFLQIFQLVYQFIFLCNLERFLNNLSLLWFQLQRINQNLLGSALACPFTCSSHQHYLTMTRPSSFAGTIQEALWLSKAWLREVEWTSGFTCYLPMEMSSAVKHIRVEYLRQYLYIWIKFRKIKC